MNSGGEEDHPDPARPYELPGGHRPSWVTPRDRRARGHLPTVPERRRTAGQRSSPRLPYPVRYITLSALSRSASCSHLGPMALQRAVYRPRDAEHTSGQAIGQKEA
jgi:hypothetical protein